MGLTYLHTLLVPIDFTDVATPALCDRDVAIGQLLPLR